MSIEQGYKIVGRAAANGVAPTILEIDDIGIKDVSGRYLSHVEPITVQLLAASVNTFIWHCHEGIWQVASVSEAHSVVGGSGATVTVAVGPAGTAPGSAVVQLTAPLVLTTTAPAGSFGTLIASPTRLGRGDTVSIVMAGTLTGLVGILTLNMKRIA